MSSTKTVNYELPIENQAFSYCFEDMMSLLSSSLLTIRWLGPFPGKTEGIENCSSSVESTFDFSDGTGGGSAGGNAADSDVAFSA